MAASGLYYVWVSTRLRLSDGPHILCIQMGDSSLLLITSKM